MRSDGICVKGKDMSYIEFNHIIKEYKTGETFIRALDDASFFVEKGELAVILGSSGAGKTTALNILGGMDTATGGEIVVDGKNITDFSPKQLVGYRRTDIGFVFQFYNLVPNLTALENVELAAQVCSDSLDAGETLDKVGLSERKNNFPAQLSGGEQQRVAIARAIAKNPKLLLCDEPTGALDYNTGKQILQLLQDTCRKDNITVLIITHNSALAPMADRLIRFKSGKVTEMTVNAHPTPIAEIEW
jgi:putative ABC transport system ATP-binding protein